MANYISEIAKMLDVNTGEYFKINGLVGTYVFTHDGLHEVDNRGDCGAILAKLLSGAYTIKYNPKKPANDEMFFIVSCDGKVRTKYWDDDSTAFLSYYKLGNFYKTSEEAEANRDKWVAFYASDKVLEV